MPKIVPTTPGPWKAGGIYVMDSTRTIAIVDSNETAHKDRRNRAPSLEEAYANARLIAAAPDLLEACEKAIEDWEHNLTEAMQMIQAAVNKAKGGE